MVRGRKLVHQASQKLIRENVPHGIFMAGQQAKEHHLIQVCSIDTLRARRLYPDADLIVIDEAHLATSESYIEFLSHYPKAFMLPVTATPFATKPLTHCAEKIVSPISMQELTDQGFLVPAKFYAPVEPNLSGIKIDSRTKDYNQKELGLAVDKPKLVGDIVENWKLFGSKRRTVCFAANIKHSRHISEQFNSAGIRAIHCDADSSDAYREHCISLLERGDISVLTNVGIFSLGVDIPSVECLILARPTKSLILYIQQVGRGLRPFENKTNCIVIDHAGNVMRHGFPADEREPTLDGKIKSVSSIKIVRCKECFAVVEKMPCTSCGFVPEVGVSTREINHEPGVLGEYQAKGSEIKEYIRTLDRIAEIKMLKPGFVWHKIKEKYGIEAAKFYLSGRFKR